jgi:hypothetical protein
MAIYTVFNSIYRAIHIGIKFNKYPIWQCTNVIQLYLCFNKYRFMPVRYYGHPIIYSAILKSYKKISMEEKIIITLSYQYHCCINK